MNIIIKDNQEHKLYFHFDGEAWAKKWEVSEDAARMLMENLVQELEPVRNKVLAGELSPLAYHIESKLFSIGLLSSYTEIPKRQIKKHLIAENFNQLDEETLGKYAAALGISVEELKKV